MKPYRPYHAVTNYHREPGGLRRLDFFVDRIETWRGTRSSSAIRVLDIGCGKGNIAMALSRLGYAVTGVDFDAASIMEAKRSAVDFGLTARFVTGSFDALADQQFDVIIASEVLEHQKDPASFLANVQLHLSSVGLLLLSVPNGKSLEERIRRLTTHTKIGNAVKVGIKKQMRHEEVQSDAGHPHELFYSLKEWQRMLLQSGWRMMWVESAAALFKEFFYLGGRYLIRRGSNVFHLFDGWDQRLSSVVPVRIADGWLIEARWFDPKKLFAIQMIPTLQSGGAEHLVHELAIRLPAEKVAVHVVSLFGGGPLESIFRDQHLPVTVFPRTNLSWWKLFFQLRRLCVMERPSIVHTHLFGADVLGRLAAWFAGVPVIISTEHNMHLEHGWLKRWLKRMWAPTTSVYIAVSEEVKQFMTVVEGLPVKKIQVIHNGVDVNRLRARPPRPFQDIPRLLTVGRLEPQKNQEVLLRALAEVQSPWRLAVVGTGSLERTLKELAEQLHISSRVEWLGYRADVPQLLADTDLYCFPSRWEGMGLAFLEAAGASVPIIASDLPVFYEIADETHVTYVSPTEVSSWTHAIEEALTHPSMAIQRANALAPSIRERFSIEGMVQSYAAIYRKQLTHRSKRS